jgi:hypothetical protein
VALRSEVLQKLHSLAQKGASGDAGEWKKKRNDVIELLPGGGTRVRFVPAEEKDTPRLVREVCRQY